MNQTLLIILLFLMVLAALSAVMIRNLLKAAISLAVSSVVLTVLLFLMKSPWAGIFELSVCSGLITVVFVSAIALTKPHDREEIAEKVKERRQRFIQLPFIAAAVAIIMMIALPSLNVYWLVHSQPAAAGFQEILWNNRQLEVLGQIIIVLTGVFGVVVLFKERDNQ